MSVVESPTLAAAIDCLRQRFERTTTTHASPAILPSKRKLEELTSGDQEDGVLAVTMRKSSAFDTPAAAAAAAAAPRDDAQRAYDPPSPSCSSSSSGSGDGGRGASGDADSSTLHFFIRGLPRTMVIHARPEETVESVHERIRRARGIPISEQRLIYHGRQLQLDCTLADCGVQNDACLQLTGRMKSTEYPRSWTLANDIILSICHLGREGKHSGAVRDPSPKDSYSIENLVKFFLEMTPKDDNERTWGHLNVFILSGAAAALVVLYATNSRPEGLQDHKVHAEKSIQHFLNLNSDPLPKCTQTQCARLVLEFCKLLSASVGKEDSLYISFRKTLSLLFESMGLLDVFSHIGHIVSTNIIQEIFPFVNELASILSTGLSECLSSGLPSGKLSQLPDTLAEFSNFLVPLLKAIQDRWGRLGPFPIPLREDAEHTWYEDWFRSLHAIFMDLLENVDRCLKKLDEISATKGAALSENRWSAWSIFLLLLTKLNDLSDIFQGAGEILHSVLLERRVPLNALIRRAKRSDSLWWLLKHRDVTDFESRRNLVMMMFPEGKDDYEELQEMLIDRSHILAESFEYIAHAEPSLLQGGLFMEFKNEEATGPGVLREWFCLLCREIFSTLNVLFVACPNDHRRFFPNPASVVDPMHLDYFGFCGRVIALALMHKVQIGIVFDRIFFLQLAGRLVSLDDIQDADPYLFNSCKKILEMDSDLLDSDDLGLTFVREIEELGSRRVVELCPGGKDITVNSRNRQKYIDLLIQHCFVTCISEQVARFSQGFNDILSNSKFQRLFFQSLEVEDFDRMLGGSDGAICMKDWKRHTEYKGYKVSDRQIGWFWKVVEGMSMEQQRVLLFFWTSVKYLPVDGFSGLSSKLYIYSTSDSHERLPTSHTCFYRLCLPAYPSLAVMHKQVLFVTQEHVGYSFGTW
uniref:HECT-type E3 ubiquitin transferase n=1 Tax=Anthurium amnicola TaxID=1678845 RepID=A0A1D1Z172_9ARAE